MQTPPATSIIVIFKRFLFWHSFEMSVFSVLEKLNYYNKNQGNAHISTISRITPQNAAQLVEEEKAILLNIRSVGETVAEHIPASLFLPFDIVNKLRIEELGVSKKAPILVCRSGVRAVQTAKSLSNEIEDVTVLDGGIVQWKEKGLPVTLGRNALSLDRQVLVGAGGMMMLFTILGLLASISFFF